MRFSAQAGLSPEVDPEQLPTDGLVVPEGANTRNWLIGSPVRELHLYLVEGLRRAHIDLEVHAGLLVRVRAEATAVRAADRIGDSCLGAVA
jgi:hypothetical protein